MWAIVNIFLSSLDLFLANSIIRGDVVLAVDFSDRGR